MIIDIIATVVATYFIAFIAYEAYDKLTSSLFRRLSKIKVFSKEFYTDNK